MDARREMTDEEYREFLLGCDALLRTAIEEFKDTSRLQLGILEAERGDTKN